MTYSYAAKRYIRDGELVRLITECGTTESGYLDTKTSQPHYRLEELPAGIPGRCSVIDWHVVRDVIPA